MTMHVHTITIGGGAYTGDVTNNAGFSWSYQHGWSEDTCWWTGARRFEIQASFAGQITQPVPAVMDDFGTLVVVH